MSSASSTQQLRAEITKIESRIAFLSRKLALIADHRSALNLETISEFATQHGTLIATFGYAVICLSGFQFAGRYYDEMGIDIANLAGISDFALMGFTISFGLVGAYLIPVALFLVLQSTRVRSWFGRREKLAQLHSILTIPAVVFVGAIVVTLGAAGIGGQLSGNARMADVSSHTDVLEYVALAGTPTPFALDFVGKVGDRMIFLKRAEEKGKEPRTITFASSAVRCVTSSHADAEECGSQKPKAGDQTTKPDAADAKKSGKIPGGGGSESNPGVNEGTSRAPNGQPKQKDDTDSESNDGPRYITVVDPAAIEQLGDHLIAGIERIVGDKSHCCEPGDPEPPSGSTPRPAEPAPQTSVLTIQEYARRILRCDPDNSISVEPSYFHFDSDLPTRPAELATPPPFACSGETPSVSGSPTEPTVWILGFASTDGDPNYNLNLAQRRADKVATQVRAWCGLREIKTRPLGESLFVGLPNSSRESTDDLGHQDRRATVIVCKPQSISRAKTDTGYSRNRYSGSAPPTNVHNAASSPEPERPDTDSAHSTASPKRKPPPALT